MLNRRQFLTTVGGGAAVAGLAPLAGCMAPQQRPPLIVPREEIWANSICQLCASHCGVRVRVMNGHPVSVEGNPLHPVNRGGLCVRGAAALQLYYDPDRLPGPMKRDPNVIGGRALASWSEALKKVSSSLQKAVAAGRGRVAVIRGDRNDATSQLLGRLVRASGSDWIVDSKTAGALAMEEVLRQMYGHDGRIVYDLSRSDFLLSVDSGLLESARDTMNLHRGFAEMRAAGGVFVHAGPRMGVTGSKADEWLPIRPSTGGVLALGVAHMLIKEGYARKEFLHEHTSGFDDWTDEAGTTHRGIRAWILSKFSPERVEEITGVGWDRVIRVAREFGSAKSPLAVGSLETTGTLPIFDLMAVQTLNAVAGAIDVPGGALLARPLPFPRLDAGEEQAGQDVSASDTPTTRTVEELAEWVLESKDPPVDVCFVHESDPVFESPRGDRVAEALRKIPLVVSTSPVVTDTVEVVDIVLPDAVWIEKACDAAGADANAYPVASLSPAAAKPRVDSRPTADVVLELARQVGGSVAARFPWKSYREVLDARVAALFAAQSGDTFSPGHRSTWTQLLERGGWRTVAYDSPEALRKTMEGTGGWWDPAYYHGEWRRLVPADGHRIDLRVAEFANPLQTVRASRRPKDGELILYLYDEMTLTTRTSGSLPYLQDLGSPLSQAGWWTVVEINPETAVRLGIVHRGHVRIKNERGEIEAVVCVTPGIRPDVAAVHTGGGRQAGGRYAAGIGANPLRLVNADYDADVRRVRRETTLVRVERKA